MGADVPVKVPQDFLELGYDAIDVAASGAAAVVGCGGTAAARAGIGA